MAKSKPVSKTKQVPQGQIDEWGNFISEFKSESDRAAVILGAAKLDLLLYQIIQKVLVASPSSHDELLDGDSALSTFSSRIMMAHRLGLISPAFTRSLHLVRRIRNTFAHEMTSNTLSSGSHADRTKELVLSFRDDHRYHEFKEIMFPDDDSPSANFRCCLAMLSGRLEHLLVNAQPLSDEDAFELLPGGPGSVESSAQPPTVASED